jgi:DNA modification methylase
MSVQVLHGDCVELMRAMPENSVDSIVTDPPYGLEFMGKEWDKLTRNQMLAEEGSRERERINEYGNSYAGRRSKLPDLGSLAKHALESQMWHQQWAEEALRVLKPGGHLLAFSATRTYHRMACAIEDAGFEIRDSIHWVYGSGFPKSLDVSKAIDKSDAAQEQQARRYRFTEWVRSTGLTSAQIDEATGTNMGGHYTTAASQPAIMTVEHLDAVRHLIGEVPEWVEAECRKRSVESKNFAAREVVGQHAEGSAPGGFGDHRFTFNSKAITTAATPEAARWEGWGTALKPAHEPIVVARKPLSGTVAGNVLVWGTGGLNIDGCRVGIEPGDEPKAGHRTATFGTQETVSGGDGSGGWQAASGRWPANVVFDRTAGEALDQQSGVSKSQGGRIGKKEHGAVAIGGAGTYEKGDPGFGDTGGASRFFTQADFGPDDWPFVYQAKPSRKERNAGLDGLPEQRNGKMMRRANNTSDEPSAGFERFDTQPATNHHPTVKPVALMRHLVRLVTPPGGTVLDPFAGSGTTLVAAVLEGFDAIGCEMTDEYLPIIAGRVAWAEEQAAARGAEQARLL